MILLHQEDGTKDVAYSQIRHLPKALKRCKEKTEHGLLIGAIVF